MAKAGAQATEVRGEARGRLLAAAAGLFARNGYAAASIREICEAAGVTPPVLYWHFRSKEGIYLAVLDEAVRQHKEAVATALARGGSATEKIVRVLETAADLAGRNRDTLLMVQAALFGLSRGAPAFDLAGPRRQFREAVLRLVEEGVGTGEFRNGDAADMTDALLGVLDIQMRAIRTGASPRTARGRIARIARVVFRGLLQPIALAVLLFRGVAVAEPAPGAVLRLTLKDAVDRGLEHNLAAIVSRQTVRGAEAEKDLARGALLPTISAGLTGARQEIDLEAYGFPVPEGQSPVVGPFNVFDARLYLAQPLLDLAAMEKVTSKSESLDAARFGAADAREVVVLTCAGLYMQAAIGASRIEAVRTQEDVARKLFDRAQRLKESGVVAGIEVLRAKVQLEAQRQRVIFAENEFEKQKLALARAIGLPMSEPFELADRLPDRAVPPIGVEEAMASAAAGRSDLMQAEALVRAGEATVRASHAERWPTLRFNADYGVIGPTTPNLESTFSVGVGLRFPLFEGGRIRARETQDDAKLERLRAERDDLRARIELEVRSALLDLGSSGERLTAARDALDLAREQLRQSEDRFGAGVAGNLEVVQAQDAFATASDNLLSAMFAQNAARIALARAVGGAERTIPTLLSAEDAHHE